MDSWKRKLGRVAVSGTIASVTSALALAAAAKAAGKGALQPLNATSHWLNGRDAATTASASLRRTGLGYATHHVATLFWAAVYEAWPGRSRSLAPLPLVRDVVVIGTVAAAVDYLATPKRFTPGWEFVLSKRGMALAYVAMGAGLVLGARLADRRGRA